MNYLDVYYRAFRNYRTLTKDNRECIAQRKAFSQSDAEKDRIIITRNICNVEEDWIEAIECGLVYIEKAIKEERQFIYSNGEVVPVEKVKHISKDSVQHLARHSNLITREQEGNDIIPDQLYSVERLNDYAVYENRFLYMLLCYLRDFVTIRYDKILELSNKYEGELNLDKEITLPKQKITYSVRLRDERRDDKYLRENNPSRLVIDRIDLILKTIMAFLATPLMEIAGKAAKLKPPITKTNVLKMDNNFKGAVALYDFIIAYDKVGYEIECQTQELSPFSAELADELSEVGTLLTFLTYEYGLGINEELKQRYADAEEAQKDELIRRNAEQLKNLKRRLAQAEETPENYILALENQIKLLESQVRQIEPLRSKVRDLLLNEAELSRTAEELREECNELRDIIVANENNYTHRLNELRVECDERIHENLVKHEKDMDDLQKSFKEYLEDMHNKMRKAEEDAQKKFDEAAQQITAAHAESEQLKSELDHTIERKRICEARIKALLVKQGETIEGDYSEKESFDELEMELEAFVKFYESRWGQAKKKIRKKLLNYQSLKGQNGRNDEP